MDRTLGEITEAPALLDELTGVGPVDAVVSHPQSDGGGAPNGCVRQSGTIRWGGNSGIPTSKPGYDWYIYLIPYKCADTDRHFDYFTYKWEGKAATKDGYRMWRFKSRAESLHPQYLWEDSQPRGDVVTGSQRQLDWAIGVSKGGAYGEVSGSYTFKAKKIHPWQDTKGKLLHTSWISDSKWGTSSDNLWNGFGYNLRVPQGNDGWDQETYVQTWTCHWVKRAATAGYSCNPR